MKTSERIAEARIEARYLVESGLHQKKLGQLDLLRLKMKSMYRRLMLMGVRQQLAVVVMHLSRSRKIRALVFSHPRLYQQAKRLYFALVR